MHPEMRDRLNDLREICERRNVTRLAIFGSAARDDFRAAQSDVDVVVEFASFDFGQHATTYFDLLDDLQRLFGRDVDLVERDAVENPYFRHSMEQSEVVVYDAA